MIATPGVMPGRVALISVHGSPLADLGTRDSGGMNVYVRELSRHLARLEVGVDVFTRRSDPDSPDEMVLEDGVRVVHLRSGPPGYVEKNQILHHLPEFVSGLKRFRLERGADYRVVHSHYWLSGWVASILRHCWSIPWIHTSHTLAEVKNRALPDGAARESLRRIDVEQRIVSAADRLLTTSASEKGELMELYRAPACKIDVVPCGVDLELFRPQERAAARALLGLPDEPTLLFVGRMDAIKGIGTLLRALPLVNQALGRVSLVVVGGDPFSPGGALPPSTRRVAREARQLGVAGDVRFVGPVPQTVLPQYYAAADVCVVPSYAESFGMVAVEAMACGRPVVASNVGGLRSTVRQGSTGFLVSGRDPADFADPIVELLSRADFASELGRQGRREVMRFDWRRISRRIMGLYDALADWRMELARAAI